MRLKQQGLDQARQHEALQVRAEQMEAEVFLRAQEVQEANERLRIANDELARRDVERAELYERLRRLDQLKTTFFAHVSHELRTPLALILGPVRKLLDEEPLSEGCTEALEIVLRNARTLLKHVNDLLDVAQLEAGKMSAHYAGVDLVPLVREVAANFDAFADENRIRYDIETPATLSAEVDPAQFQRIVLNLLSNAFKFTPEGGRIRCELRAVESHIEDPSFTVRVTDTGPGVAPEIRETVFQRFYQAEEHSTRRFGGTGLGLAIVRDFAELHHGSVTVGDARGGGAEFVVR